MVGGGGVQEQWITKKTKNAKIQNGQNQKMMKTVPDQLRKETEKGKIMSEMKIKLQDVQRRINQLKIQ